MTTESQVDVFTPAERINLMVQFAGQAMQGLLANAETARLKPAGDKLAAAAVGAAEDTLTALEDHFRKEYAAKAAELKAAQDAASAPRILVPGGGIIQ